MRPAPRAPRRFPPFAPARRRAWSRPRALAFALAATLAGIAPLGARAQVQAQATPIAHPATLAPRQANYAWDSDLLRGSFSYRDVLADPDLVKKLSSGLPMVIVMRAYVYREGQSAAEDTPVALAPRVCRVVYDLWDEVYRVHVSEPERERDQAAVLDGVFRLCTEARDLPVVRRGLLQAHQAYFLGVVVDVNPVSQEIVDQIHRWMSRPTGSTGIGPSDALFGSFAQLFVRQIATTDRTLTFRTQDVVPQ
ncbi:MAG TPA: hypothetical protein VK762_35745 [Polyangiaceae bacterium]|jgi:hypothetical protein|nr:hypothetical protein [Polyangiaceae bacterium]